ncbi:MAG TPA: ABC transporter permease [Accumulibacter sp.]|uniref:ABC transporter permease n=1 Tax=Accumulibacter sp. TaxID=2053492 RepID=UPI001AC1877A|nr:ABC transporter permease [Accumulibacter sp.]MBN8519296.1 ABC transporter permease [Accumulibacter sp.]MBO3711782.1 ABC transporter permease [Accumulibacter sp.]MCM8579514.1 ABC transporter permease [Accumulibacter sp.]HMW55272.1 ABC transporter permease [Accumulibacter sp.]HNC20332.1 ABC transporter permease [Accumulibacter sp.]
MRAPDLIRFARDAATGNPLRTFLLVLAMAIGVAAVVVLTALGDGARRYVLNQFASIGSNLVIVLPGRSQTGGFNPGNAITSTPRDLTIDDAQALRRASAVHRVAPLTVGTSEISFGGKLREVMVAGTTAEFIEVRRLTLAQGRFLPQGDWRRGVSEAVIGAKIRNEMFAREEALGQMVRIGDRRFRIVGVLASTGQGLGMNTDELVIVPVSLAQAMFNSNTLFRILVEASSRDSIDQAKAQLAEIIQLRHEGEQDVTIITQDAVLATFDRLLGTMTIAVAGIAAISLAVAGILVMNVMLVSVTQRTTEIGLLKALGATGATIRNAFLTEAAMLSVTGALLGWVLGLAMAAIIRQLYPEFPAFPPDWAVLAGLGTALATGILFGVLPARQAARLDPVQSLSKR